MPEPSPPPLAPWTGGLTAGLGAALITGVVVAVIDAAGAGAGTLPALLAMWAPPTLVIGLLIGVTIAGFRATFGDGALGAAMARLRRDPALDRALTGAVLASAVVGLLLVALVAVAAAALVANVERKDTGARLLGVVVVAAVPLVAALGFPIYRGTRWLARGVPSVGRLPRVAVLVVGAIAAIGALGAYVVFTQLDWRALGLGGYLLLAGLFGGAVVLAAAAQGPLRGLVSRLPARGVLVAIGASIAVVLPVAVLRGTPSPDVRDRVTDHAMGGSKLLRIYRGMLDRDGDGQSAFFGGPDCDDTDATIYNGADEIKDDGIDQNCDGRDRVSRPDAPDADAVATTREHPDTGHGAATTRAAAMAPTANVVIVMIDTLRADRLGVAGYRRDGASLTPALDAFAATATRFTSAFSQAPNTPRAMPAFMASRYPSMVPVDKLFKNYPVISNDAVMLFEVLQQAGVATFGYSSHFYFRDERNFTQGFDLYDNEGALDIAPSNKDTASPRIVPKVLAKLDELAASQERFAMWVHLFEPHSTYMEHDGWKITERGTAGLMQKYDYEIAYTDGWVAKILDKLDASGLANNTVVVIVSDHGEAFGVHTFGGQKMFFHGQTLYDELLRVPLLVRVPGATPSVSDAVVQLIDVAPTILDVLGIEPPSSFLGRSLAPAVRGDGLEPRPAYAELIPYPSWNHEGRAVISPDGTWKLFDRISDNRKELYNLAEDPEERVDRGRQAKDKLHELEDLLLELTDLRKRETGK
jgi:arylsulfatase A-like enzyme